MVLTICLPAGSAFAQSSAPRPQVAPAASVDLSLDGNDWRMSSFDLDQGEGKGASTENFDDRTFRSVTVPGDTQVQAGFTGVDGFRESKGLLDVNRKEWWYRKQFAAPSKVPDTRTRLLFEGSDYFTTVWLNGRLLGTHEGAYTSFSFDVTGLLRYGQANLLAVKVTHPWIPKDRALVEYLNGDFSMTEPWALPVLSKPPSYIDVRWDALPSEGNAAYPMGIWRDVHLQTSGTLTISDLHAETMSIAPDGSAMLHLSATVSNAESQPAARRIDLTLQPANFAGAAQAIPALSVTALPGQTTVEADVRVPDAHLWWSWDKGPQNLYDLKASFAAQGSIPGAERDIRIGIRTVTRDPDMAYRVNGQKLFVKASWFPIESFYRSEATAQDYERDLRLFMNANYDLLVNFTVVEKPEFYDLCDRLGILVVEEMPFAQFGPQQILDKDSPRREPFLEQARTQITQIVTTQRNHPSIMEWAPLAEAHDKNNGDRWGINNLQPDQAGYDTFIAQMKAIVTRLEPTAIFHPSLCDLGEQHYWMAEAGARYIHSNYQEHFDVSTGFVSEYGSISMPSFENIGKYLTPEQQWNPNLSAERRWFGLPIDTTAYSAWTSFFSDGLYSMLYRNAHFIDRDPRSAKELVQDTQLYQAFLMRYAAEAYRRKKYDPINGIRNWDFVELAPGSRFGTVDFDRVPKIAYWYLKHAQAPVAISFAYKEALESQLAGSHWSAPLWIINDFNHPVTGTIHARLLTLTGDVVSSTDYPVSVPSDGKLMAGTFSLTLPQAAGVYVLRASLTSSSAGADPVEETSFVKVVPPAFSGSHRVLLIAQKKYAAPIQKIIEALGVAVDLYDENAIDRMATDLNDGAAIHARYDVIWLGSFEALAKVLSKETATALVAAVKAGSGFIHTGGPGSFHGGQGHSGLVEATDLDALLPVQISGHEDTNFGPHSFDDTYDSQPYLHDITPDPNVPAKDTESLDLLRHYGLLGFNRVTSRPASHTLLSIASQPLLTTGSYGQGKTVAFTGFTPAGTDETALPIDQYLVAIPQIRAYFAEFADLLAEAMPQPQPPAPGLLAAHEKPLFQSLKEQPETELEVTRVSPIENGDGSLRCRVRITSKQGYAHLVHLQMAWKQSGSEAYLTGLTDNDFELLPKESKEVEVQWRRQATAPNAGGKLIVSAMNSRTTSLPL
jgi:beta-mannosidase